MYKIGRYFSQKSINQQLLTGLFVLSLLLLLCGCGRKPDFVDFPQGTQNKSFPRTYPAPE